MDKERGKIEYLQVPRGVEEIERILHAIRPKKVSMTAMHVYTYASGLGYRISSILHDRNQLLTAFAFSLGLYACKLF